MNRRIAIFYGTAIALLAVGLIVYILLFPGRLSYTKDGAARHQLQAIELALSRYAKDNGSFPGNDVGLTALLQPHSEGRFFRNDSYLIDPWQHKIVYVLEIIEGRGEKYRLYSIGQNGKDEHGKGDDILVVGECRKGVRFIWIGSPNPKLAISPKNDPLHHNPPVL